MIIYLLPTLNIKSTSEDYSDCGQNSHKSHNTCDKSSQHTWKRMEKCIALGVPLSSTYIINSMNNISLLFFCCCLFLLQKAMSEQRKRIRWDSKHTVNPKLKLTSIVQKNSRSAWTCACATTNTGHQAQNDLKNGGHYLARVQ